jgi:hypothetical protein
MLRCKTCGAECQNPLDRYGETFLKWIGIHTRYPHEIESIGNAEVQILAIKEYYDYYHDKKGNRIIPYGKA